MCIPVEKLTILNILEQVTQDADELCGLNLVSIDEIRSLLAPIGHLVYWLERELRS